MKRFYTFFIFTLLTCHFSQASIVERTSPLTGEKECVMCPVMPDQPAQTDHYVDHDGARVYMCCKTCESKFSQNPEKYSQNVGKSVSYASLIDVGGEDKEAEEADEEFEHNKSFWTYVGKMHVLLVHFPIGLLVAAGLMELAAYFYKRPDFSVWAGMSVLLATVFIVLAAVAGMIWVGGFTDDTVLESHRWFGVATTIMMVLSSYMYWKSTSPNRLKWYRIWLIGSIAGIIVTGHLGGVMVYGADFLF